MGPPRRPTTHLRCSKPVFHRWGPSPTCVQRAAGPEGHSVDQWHFYASDKGTSFSQPVTGYRFSVSSHLVPIPTLQMEKTEAQRPAEFCPRTKMSGTESESSPRQGKPNAETFPQHSTEWQRDVPAGGTWVHQPLPLSSTPSSSTYTNGKLQLTDYQIPSPWRLLHTKQGSAWALPGNACTRQQADQATKCYGRTWVTRWPLNSLE